MNDFIKKRGGRPQKEPKEKADKVVKVCFTEEEYRNLMRRKLRTKSRSLSDFVRSACLEKPLILREETTPHQEKMESLLREIRADLIRIGIQTNQAIRRLQTTNDSIDVLDQTTQLRRQLQEIEDLFRAILCINSLPDQPINTENGRTNQ